MPRTQKSGQAPCALTSIANLLTQTGRPTTESQVVSLAISNNWTVNNPSLPSYILGGASVNDQRNILNSYGIRNDVVVGYNESGLANLLRGGRGVILAVNAGVLWADSAYKGSGAVNHAVTLTGAVYTEADGALAGFYLTDSGRGKVSDMTRFVDIATFRQMANVPSAYAIYTIEPVKFWQEDINGTGNDLENNIAGNRGDNLLSGLAGNDVISADAGNDTLVGGTGNDQIDGGSGDDVYRYGLGDGADTINDSDGTDTLELGPGIVARDVQVSLANGRLTLGAGSGSVSMQAGAGKLLEQVQFADGTVWHARSDGTGYNARLTGQASISGQMAQGQTLTVVSTLSDPDGMGALSYQWERSANGVDWSGIANATTGSLLLDQGLVGQQIRARLSFVDGRGNLESAVGYGSTATAQVANVNDAPTGGVTISGIAAVGQTLQVNHTLADADGLGTINWQWLANGQAISGATGTSFTLTSAQADMTITAQASYVDGYGTPESVSSAATARVMRTFSGTMGNDWLTGTSNADRLAGAAGSDTYVVDHAGDMVVENANEGTDTVYAQINHILAANVEQLYLSGNAAINGTGNELNNSIFGNSAANVLNGGAGNDTLDGGAGGDTYIFGRGSGQDLVTDYEVGTWSSRTVRTGIFRRSRTEWTFTPPPADVVQSDSSVASNQLWFRRTGNDLEMSVIGTSDRLTVSNWYLDAGYQVELFRAGDGKTLRNTQVEALVSAMAQFSPPASGQTTLSTNQQAALAATLAATWT